MHISTYSITTKRRTITTDRRDGQSQSKPETKDSGGNDLMHKRIKKMEHHKELLLNSNAKQFFDHNDISFTNTKEE